MKILKNIKWTNRSALLWGFVLISVWLSGCATNPVTGGQDIVLMTEEQEIELGRKSHIKILKQYTRYEDPEIQTMVERIGQKLAAQSHRSELTFTFTVLDSPEVNAFALPGGYVYITRGIMAYLNSEQELAGVLGHEIGHVTARHGVKQQTAQTASGVFGLIVAVATGDGNLARASNYAGAALVSGYGRNHELEADRLGAEYLARINYDPESMLEVIGVLKDQELFAQERARETGETAPSGYHGLFSSHPQNDRRLQEVIAAAKQFQTAEPVKIDGGDYLKKLDGMTFGNSEAQGIVHKNEFYHHSLDIHLAFPDGWKLINQPDHLLGVSGDAKQLIQFRLGDPDAKAPEAYLRKTFPDMKSGQALSRDIFAGVSVLDSPWGKRAGRVAAVRHKSNIFIIMGVGESQLSKTLFNATLESIGSLNLEQRKLARGRKIKLIRAKSGDTFASLAKQSNIDQFGISTLRLLNDLYPDGEPQAGQYIKLVK
jgi:predicted Zn-dependent protease